MKIRIVMPRYGPRKASPSAFKLGHTVRSDMKGKVHNPLGVGGVQPGDPGRNQHGSFEVTWNKDPRIIAGLAKGRIKKGEVRNPYGILGKKGYEAMTGVKLKPKRKREKLLTPQAADAKQIQDIARRAAPEAMRALANIVKSKTAPEQARIAAANTIFERGYGKPTQTTVTANLNADGKESELTGEQLDARIAETINRVEAITSGERKAPPRQKRPIDIRKYN